MNGEENTDDQMSVRFLNRLNVYLSSNKFYEAHQTYRALATRWTQQRKFSSLLPILYESVGKFSEKGQNLIAEDMAGLYVVALKASKSPINCSVISNLKSIFQWMIRNFKSDSQERFLNQILEWSLEVSPEYPRGHPDLHRMYVEVYHERCNFHSSIFHIMLTEDGQYIGKYLAECFLKYGVQSELDIFITQFLLRNEVFAIFQISFEILRRYFGVPLQENNRTSNFLGNIVRRMFRNDANDATSSTVAQMASGDANNVNSNNIPVAKPSSSSSTAISTPFENVAEENLNFTPLQGTKEDFLLNCFFYGTVTSLKYFEVNYI
ncbi:Golgi to ER traffic protein [Trichinella pseudospiralis]